MTILVLVKSNTVKLLDTVHEDSIAYTECLKLAHKYCEDHKIDNYDIKNIINGVSIVVNKEIKFMTLLIPIEG